MRIDICGVGIDDYSFDQVVNILVQYALSEHTPQYVVTPNAHHIVSLQRDQRFREIYQNALLSVPDGKPLLWVARLLGKRLKERVTGVDLFEQLCGAAAPVGLRVFFLGGRPGAAIKAAQILQDRYPGLEVAGTYCPPYGFERSEAEQNKIAEAIKEAKPHFLFVGLGAPKQEYWIYEHYQDLNVPLSFGIGASFEFVSGLLPRAPKLMQTLGMEWFFRLATEPGRLWKRYLVVNSVFVWLVLRQILGFQNQVYVFQNGNALADRVLER